MPFFRFLQINLLIVDEAHRLKNPKTLFYQNLEDLNIPHTFLLTGTPIQNSLTELYALLRFSNPMIWGDKVALFLEWFDPGFVKEGAEKKSRMDELKELLKQ